MGREVPTGTDSLAAIECIEADVVWTETCIFGEEPAGIEIDDAGAP